MSPERPEDKLRFICMLTRVRIRGYIRRITTEMRSEFYKHCLAERAFISSVLTDGSAVEQ